MKTLTILVMDFGSGMPTPRVYTPGGEDITECLLSLEFEPLTYDVIPTAVLSAHYITAPQHTDPVLYRLEQSIKEITDRHLREMRTTWRKQL